jgi:hypothetical protein
MFREQQTTFKAFYELGLAPFLNDSRKYLSETNEE